MKRNGVIFILFGATGDLSKRKLIPAIYHLLKDNRLGHFHVIGLARRPLTSKQLINASKPFIKKPKTSILSKIIANTTYLPADFSDPDDYARIRMRIEELEAKGTHDKIFYLATGSHNFHMISENLVRSRIAEQKNCKTKVVFEKPFGRDLRSAKRLNRDLRKIFSEDQMYRIDHYLGKELVGSVSILRFTNKILEPIWNRKHIKDIQIILDENVGIDERGSYYDTYGAIRDMVQNHMLQLLALLTMEMPKRLTGKYVRSKKAKLLRNVRVVDSLLGQYTGYRSEKGVPRSSKTETFAALALQIKTNRWKGVPILFRTGKFLKKKESKIIVNFKKAACPFEHECSIIPNSLEIRIYPNEGITLNINTKAPGKYNTAPITLDFHYKSQFGPNTPEGYENLFADTIAGDQTVFTRIDELLNAWRVVDTIKRDKVYSYPKGSAGPKELTAFSKRHGVHW